MEPNLEFCTYLAASCCMPTLFFLIFSNTEYVVSITYGIQLINCFEMQYQQ